MKRRLSAGMISCMLALCIVPVNVYAQNNRGVARAGTTYQETVAGSLGKSSLKYTVTSINGANKDGATARMETNVSATLKVNASITYSYGSGTVKSVSAGVTKTGLSCAASHNVDTPDAIKCSGIFSYRSNGYGSVDREVEVGY